MTFIERVATAWRRVKRTYKGDWVSPIVKSMQRLCATVYATFYATLNATFYKRKNRKGGRRMGKAEDLSFIKEASEEAVKALELLTKPQDEIQRNDPSELNRVLIAAYVAVSLLSDTISDSIENITRANDIWKGFSVSEDE